MKRNLGLIVVLVLMATLAFAQAKPGYNGDTFTGTLTGADDAARTITLSAEVDGQAQTFTGMLNKLVLQTPDGQKKEIKPSDFPKNAKLTVKFKKKMGKDGKEVNEIKDVQMLQ